MTTAINTVDKDEVERFSRIADEWWDERGKFAPLHKINPLRVAYIRERIVNHLSTELRVQSAEKQSSQIGTQHSTTLKGIRLLDIGCGGGLISEPMAKLGMQVTGIDASEKNIAVARLHAEKSGIEIDYRCTTAEELVAANARYDVVLALEIIEHVADIPAFVECVCKLAKPGGLVIFSTMNRTAKAYALAIVGAEYVLRWLPRGTHTWSKFVKPSELSRHLRANNTEVKDMTGMVMNPLTMKWELRKDDVSVNYLLTATRAFSL